MFHSEHPASDAFPSIFNRKYRWKLKYLNRLRWYTFWKWISAHMFLGLGYPFQLDDTVLVFLFCAKKHIPRERNCTFSYIGIKNQCSNQFFGELNRFSQKKGLVICDKNWVTMDRNDQNSCYVIDQKWSIFHHHPPKYSLCSLPFLDSGALKLENRKEERYNNFFQNIFSYIMLPIFSSKAEKRKQR